MNADPIEDEFFSTEALGSLTDSLVRETIQNSLDARLPDSKTVRVSFRVFRSQTNRNESREKYLSELNVHLSAKGNGLPNSPKVKDPLEYLVIEDYGTKGLEGNPEQADDSGVQSNVKNDFFYFWRNIGRSEKSEEDIGRWGLGKTVFQSASRINSFFGVTVRKSDGQSLLMGQSVLKTHFIDGGKYCPYGWYGVIEKDGFALPVKDAPFIAQFRENFNLKRCGEPGLSVVVPYPDSSINAKEIIFSSIYHYFFLILSGRLVVEVSQDGKNEVINESNISSHVSKVDLTEKKLTKENFERLLDTAKWAIQLEDKDFIKLDHPAKGKAPKWSETIFPKNGLEQFSERIDRGERLAFRIPLTVKKTGSSPHESWFDVFVERDPSLERPEDHFIREGITIAGIRSLKQRNFRAIVFIRDKALSTLLGDSENPSHTEWQKLSSKFQGVYEYGASCLQFVKNSPDKIIGYLSRPSKKKDEKLLSPIFSVPDIPSKNPKGKDGKKNPIPPIPTKEQPLNISRIDRGVRFSGNFKTETFPKRVQITMAYEIRRGNPFVNYSPYDFKLDQSPIKMKARGCKIKEKFNNHLLIEVKKTGFWLDVIGFDSRRDIRIKTEIVEGVDS